MLHYFWGTIVYSVCWMSEWYTPSLGFLTPIPGLINSWEILGNVKLRSNISSDLLSIFIVFIHIPSLHPPSIKTLELRGKNTIYFQSRKLRLREARVVKGHTAGKQQTPGVGPPNTAVSLPTQHSNPYIVTGSERQLGRQPGVVFKTTDLNWSRPKWKFRCAAYFHVTLDKLYDQFKHEFPTLKMGKILQPPKEIMRIEWHSVWNLISAQKILAIKDKASQVQRILGTGL